MSSFNPGNKFAVARAFSAKSSTFKTYPRDIALTIESYEGSSIRGKDLKTGEEHLVSVDAEAIARNRQREQTDKDAQKNAETAEWLGYLIDDRMAQKLTVGSVIVAEANKSRKETIGGKTVQVGECQRIINPMKNYIPEKVRHGIFTVRSYNGRVTNVQSWHHDRPAVLATDDQARAQLVEALNQSRARYEQDRAEADASKRLNQPTWGVKFRFVVPVSETDRQGKTINKWKVINDTDNFDWVRAEKETRDGKEVILKPGYPIDGPEFLDLLNRYADYLYGVEGDPESVPKFPQEVLDVGAIEINTYDTFQAAPKSDSMVVRPGRFDPITVLATTRTKHSDDGDDIVGSLAVDGIIVLSSDKPPSKPGESWEARNLVTRLFANGPRKHVQKFLRSHTNEEVIVDPALDVVRDNPRQEAEHGASAPTQHAAQAAQRSTMAPPPSTVSAPASAPLLTPSAQDPFTMPDPFINATQAPAPQAASPAPAAVESVTQAEPEPTTAESLAEAGGEAEPAATATSSFRRPGRRSV